MNINIDTKNSINDITKYDTEQVYEKEDKLDFYKKIIDEKNTEIILLKQNIKYRDITISIYRNLIESKFGFKLNPETYEDIIIQSNMKFKYSNEKKNKSIKKIKKKVTPKQSNIKSSNKKSKKVYINKKKIPSTIIFTKEKSNSEIQNLIKEKNSQFVKNTSPTKLWSFKKEDHLNIIKDLIDDLRNNTRSYSKELNQIKTHRLHLLKYLNEDEYKKLVLSQCEEIKEIFKSRGKDDKKIKVLVRQKILGAYEHRMLFLDYN